MAANRERWWKHINQYHFCWKNQPNADRSTKRHFDKLIIVSSKKTLMNKIMIIPTSSKSVKFGGTKWNGATRPTNYRDGGAKFEQIDKIGNCLASRLISSSSSSSFPPPSLSLSLSLSLCFSLAICPDQLCNTDKQPQRRRRRRRKSGIVTTMVWHVFKAATSFVSDGYQLLDVISITAKHTRTHTHTHAHRETHTETRARALTS